ncbi:lipid phosphate phosphatase epsilon 2, chloroplastic-like [Brassica napus]|uniref:lipid phosphate phosphatase epsilon 2, chloroplastic-like n=1 Tax=Brassica napus TaxID=3708 RepID=UPI00207872CD|nr:lipid phosphate phosphatase epsilon 2, chloroplastic-like [Brassica napus]
MLCLDRLCFYDMMVQSNCSSFPISVSLLASFSHLSKIHFTIISPVMEWLGTNELSLFLIGLILALASYFTWLRVSQKVHTTNQVVVGAIVGSVYSTLLYITWNSLVLEAFASSFSVQVAVFTAAAAASALGFAVYVLLNWFKDDDR